MTLLGHLITGLSLGSIYAIIALGYTMVYGIAKMLNFAHGDVIMVGAYICFFAVTSFSLPPVVGVLLAMVVCTILGVVIEGLAYKPLRQAPSLAVLITAIGVSYFLQNSAQILWGADYKSFPNFLTVNGQTGVSLFGGQLNVTYTAIVTVLACVVIMLAIGSALAAVAGVLMCSAYPTLSPTTGSLPGIRAFTAAVFGGIGSIPGALLGGIMLGLVETLTKAYITTSLYDAVVFALLIVVLLVKPSGLLGRYVPEKV